MKVQKFHDALVFTSALTFNEMNTAELLCKNSLTLKDDNDDAVFAISYSYGKPSVGKYGIAFNRVDDNGHLTLTIVDELGMNKHEIAEMFRDVLVYAPRVEAQVKDALGNVEAELEGLEDLIEIL